MKSTKEIKTKEKKAKVIKTIQAKKLPGILKKKYSEKKFQKKILKKIYIPSDKKLIESAFEKDENNFYLIPKTKEFEKKEFKKIALIGKQVKKQKGAVKLAPLIAVVTTLVVLVVGVITFKNVVFKYALTQTMQGIFGAKTDVKSVNIQIMGASINISGLAQANKDSPMKNIFEVEKIVIDFNLTEALRGKFDAQNIAVEGVAIGTERTVSGELPVKPSKTKEESKLNNTIEEKKAIALASSQKQIEELFSTYNPEAIISGLNEKLQSPTIAKEVQSDVESLVNKWQDTPAKIESQVTTLTNSVNDVINTDWSNVNDVAKLKTAIETITKATQSVNECKATVEETLTNVKADSETVKATSQKVQKAIQADLDLANTEIDKIKSFTIKDGVNLISGSLDSVLYDVIGKYYPYAKTAINYALQAKASSSSTKSTTKTEATKAAKKTHTRLSGVNVFYKKDKVPSFLLEKVSFSGSGLKALATDISNDMDKREAPAIASGTLDLGSINHSAKVQLDTREETPNSLITANYTGSNYPFEVAVPTLSLGSKMKLLAEAALDDSGTTSIDATMNLQNVKLSADSFEPEFAYNIYTAALKSIKTMSVQAKITIENDGSLDFSLSSDADKQFSNILKTSVNSALSQVKDSAIKEVKNLLNSQTSGVTDKLSEFVDIENGINAQSLKTDKLTKELNSKKTEIENQIKEKTTSAATEAIDNAIGNNEATKNASELLKGLF